MLRTAILKFPVNGEQDKDAFLQNMQEWSGLPFHERMLRPLCFASLNEDTPLVFIEDMPFVHTLEDVVLERSFYRGYQFRFEISHKILSCAIQVAEALDHIHSNGLVHLNLHAGNVMTPRCADRDEHQGFFTTDLGNSLFLSEETMWTDKHEKVYNRLQKFYPPNILSMIKQFATAKLIEDKREILRRLKIYQNVLVDIYSFGVLVLFLITGGYEWSNTLELASIFEAKMQKAESIVDLQTVYTLKAMLKRCLLISRIDQPFDKISDLLPNLRTAKQTVERVMQQHKLKYYTYDKLHKPLYEFLPGKKKEELVSKKLEFSHEAEEFAIGEREVFNNRFKKFGMKALGPEIQEDEQGEKENKPFEFYKPEQLKQYNDQDMDLAILNNQAVLAYVKQNYDQCLHLFFKFHDLIETHPIAYFNYLVLCWESALYTDDFVLSEVLKITTHPQIGQNFSSLLLGLLYEAQNNWIAAKTNYELAMFTASDSCVTEVRNRLQNAKYFYDKYPDQFLFGHLEMSDVQDLVVSFNGKMAVSFQKTSRIIVWNLGTQKILKEIEDKNATCMDANAKLDRIVVGLRSGLIVLFNLAFDGSDFIVNVEEVELGYHVNTVLVVKLSRDGYYGLSGGLDPYLALWNCQKKLLLSKIDISGQYLKSAAINMNGETFMFSTSNVYSIQVYQHHFASKKGGLEQIFSLDKHRAQVTTLELACDGLLGVSGGQDRKVYFWDLLTGDCLRELQVTSFVVRLCLTPMAKFLGINLLDGSIMLYELVTGIIWKTERLPGKHTALGVMCSNFMFEVAKEGLEHKLIDLLERDRQRLVGEFQEARGLDESESEEEASAHTSKKSHHPGKTANRTKVSAEQMPTVVEVDEEESEYRRTRELQEGKQGESRQSRRDQQRLNSQQSKRPQSQQEQQQPMLEDEIHEINRDEEIMLQDLFFENAIFKYYYFQSEDLTKGMSPSDIQQELASISFERARDPYQENHYLLKSSLDNLRVQTSDMSPQAKALQNFEILESRRSKFDQLIYRNFQEIERIRSQYSKCRLLLIGAETRAGEDSDIIRQGSVVGLRVLQVNLPFIGIGPCQFITNADVTRNIQVKVRIKAKEMREQGIRAFLANQKEQAKYYFQRMRETQPLYMNPSAIKYWASLQMESFKKGNSKIHNIFKVKTLVTRTLHQAPIEHMRFTRNEHYLVLMSRDFRTTLWSVGDWSQLPLSEGSFRAYHEAHAQFYMREVNDEQIIEEFDVAVISLADNANLLMCGLYNGALQFWENQNSGTGERKFEVTLEIPSHLAEVTAIEFNGDNSLMVSAGSDYLINVWSVAQKTLLFEIREHLGAIKYLGFVEEEDEHGKLEEVIVSVDQEGYMIYVSLDGYIEKKFSTERSATHALESMDVLFSAYCLERELFLVRRNLNTSFYEFQKIKAGVEPYYAAFDTHTFPTIIKNKVDKRQGVDYLFANTRGEFVLLGQKRDNQLSFRNSSTLVQEKRLELKEQINVVVCGQRVPYMIVNTDKGTSIWMIEWDLV